MQLSVTNLTMEDCFLYKLYLVRNYSVVLDSPYPEVVNFGSDSDAGQRFKSQNVL
jgi:hypothetical protein